MTPILGALDPSQFWILVLTLWCGIVAVIGCTIWAVSHMEYTLMLSVAWAKGELSIDEEDDA